MNIYYNIEVQMAEGNERNYDLDEMIGRAMGFNEEDIDEREPYMMTALFVSQITPLKMRQIVRKFVTSHTEIYYMDVMYRWEYENVPDKFVVWNDGRQVEYTGHIEFREDKTNE